MPEDPTSWYCWWAIKDLQLRRITRYMSLQNLTPRQKRRRLLGFVLMLLVYVPLSIYMWILMNRAIGH